MIIRASRLYKMDPTPVGLSFLLICVLQYCQPRLGFDLCLEIVDLVLECYALYHSDTVEAGLRLWFQCFSIERSITLLLFDGI